MAENVLDKTWCFESPKDIYDINTALNDKEILQRFMFECPECHLVPIPPVYLCKIGHIICNSCLRTVKKCSICKSSFDSGTRNLFYEKCFAKMSFSCRYAKEGCKVTLLGKDIKNHQETKCDFRPVPCLRYTCSNSNIKSYVAFSKYKAHYLMHGGDIFSSNHAVAYNNFPEDVKFDWSNSRWAHIAFDYKGFTFFAVSQVMDPLVGIWLYILGSEEEANRFHAKIYLGLPHADFDKGIHKQCFRWEGPVHSIRKTGPAIMNEGKCFITSLATVKQLLCKRVTKPPFWKVEFKILDKADYESQHALIPTANMKISSSQINLSGGGGGNTKLTQQNAATTNTQQNHPKKPLPQHLTIPSHEEQATQHNHELCKQHHQQRYQQRSKSADARPIPDEYQQQRTIAAGTSASGGTQNQPPGISKQGGLYYYQSSPYYYYYAASSSRGGGNTPVYEYEYDDGEVVSMCEPISANNSLTHNFF